MHEMSLCEGVLQILEHQALQQQYRRVKTVWLEIGKLSGVEPDAMCFSFDVVMQGSIADQAKLEIIEIPAKAWCMQCMKIVQVEHRYDECPSCGGYQLQINDGDQMRIKELEVE